MKEVKRSEIKLKFKKIGIQNGRTILISSSFLKIGTLIRIKNKKKFYDFFYKILIDLLGSNGNLAVNSFTTQVARNNLIYEFKKTNSNASGFDNFLRKKKESYLSFHIANSVSVIGKNAKQIVTKTSINNYGYNSVYFNLLKHNPLIIRIGLDFALNAYTHVAETLMGVPYIYNKIVRFKYKKNKKIISDYHTMAVRYLNLKIEYDYKKIENDLKKEIYVKEVIIGNTKCYSLKANDYLNFVLKKLSVNPHYLLKKIPNYKFGTIPYDGPSKGRDGV